MRKLQAYSWPGNVRQLRAAIENAAVMCENDVIDAESFPLAGVSELPSSGTHKTLDLPMSLDMEEIETWAIRKALKQTTGNVSHAAKLLGMSRDTLHTKIKKKGIDREAIVNSSAIAGTGEPVAVE
jgi:DNA-binding NtrC family response regulator